MGAPRITGIGGMRVCGWCFHPVSGADDLCPGCNNELYDPPVASGDAPSGGHKRPQFPVSSSGRPGHQTGHARPRTDTSPDARKAYLRGLRRDPPIRPPADGNWLAHLADADLLVSQCESDLEEASANYRYSAHVIEDEHLADRALSPQRRHEFAQRAFAKNQWEEATRAWERAKAYYAQLEADYTAVHDDMHAAPGRRDSLGLDDDDGSIRFGEKLAEISRRNKRR